jgi:quinol monooxygenase YgiN
MHIRSTWLQASPDQVEQVTSNFKEKVMPSAKQVSGYAGAALFVNRETGLCAGVTVWESAKALAASEEFGLSTRTQAAAASNAPIVNVERQEVVLMDRAAPPSAPGYARTAFGYTDPEKLDQVIELVRNKVVPTLRECKGYRSCLMAVDRTTGQTAVMNIWESAADREASESKIKSVREEASKLTGTPVRIELSEQVAVELLQPAMTR